MRLVRTVLFIAIGAVLGWRASVVRGLPSLRGIVRVSECIASAGHVLHGEPIKHSFWIRNCWNRRLVVKRISGRGVTAIERDWLDPGKTVWLRIRVDTSRGEPGYWRISTRVFFQGMDEPLLLQLTGWVEEVFPLRIRCGNVLREEDAAIKYDVLSGPRELHLLGAVYPEVYFRLNTRKTRNGFRIELTPTQRMPYGPFTHRITLVTDDPFLPKKTTTITGKLLDRIVVDRDHVSLGILQPRSTVTRTIQLHSSYGDNFSITRLNCNIAGVRLRSTPTGASDSHSVLVSTKSRGDRAIAGRISINTNDPKRHFVIPVYGLSLTQRE